MVFRLRFVIFAYTNMILWLHFVISAYTNMIFWLHFVISAYKDMTNALFIERLAFVTTPIDFVIALVDEIILYIV